MGWHFVPSTQLSGDMFGYHWLGSDHLAVYLLGVSGHGVGFSLLAVSAANLLSAGSLPENDFRGPGAVASSRSGQRRTRGDEQSVEDRLAVRRHGGPGQPARGLLRHRPQRQVQRRGRRP